MSDFTPKKAKVMSGRSRIRHSIQMEVEPESEGRLQRVGSLSSDVFERRTSTGSKPFSLLISLDATVFLLPSVLILIETICPKMCSKSWLKSAKRPLPVDVRRSKTSLLKLPNVSTPAREKCPWYHKPDTDGKSSYD